MSKEYLVIYEDTQAGGDDEPDELVLDIHMLRQAFTKQVDVEAQVHVDMEGRSNQVGLVGLLVASLGSLLSLIGVVTFATTYPSEWYQGFDFIGDSLARLTATLFVLGGLGMLTGTILTASGRRVTASGRIDEAHIVSKEPHGHAELNG